MEKVINLGIPHVGEIFFDNIDTEELIQCLFVSQNWRVLVTNVLLKRHSLWDFGRHIGMKRQKFMIACFNGHTDIVKLFLDMSNIELNARNDFGDTAFILA